MATVAGGFAPPRACPAGRSGPDYGPADPILCDTIDRLIMRMQEELNVTSVVISHDIEGAFKIGDHIAMLHDGRIRASGTPEAIRNTEDPVVRQFITGSADGPIQVV